MWWIVFKRAFWGFWHKEEVFISGTLAFYALLAFFPFVIFLTSLAGLYSDALNVQEALHYLIHNTPREVREVILPVLDEISTIQEGSLVTISFLGTLLISMSGVDAFRLGLNRAYEITEKRPLLRRKLQDLAFVLLAALGLTLTSVAIILGPLLLEICYRWLPPLEQWAVFWNLLRYVFALGLMFILLSSMYYFLPNIHHQWRGVWPGALIATLLWTLLASLFSFYLAHAGNYSITYGSLSGIIIVLLFLKASAIIFLIGAEINHAYLQYQHAENRGEEPKE